MAGATSGSLSASPSASASSGSGDEKNARWARQEEEEWAAYDREWAAHRLNLYVCGVPTYLFNLKDPHSKRKAEADHIQTKRDQWKAASARYYERHPEVKEKKRLRAAEKQCIFMETRAASLGSAEAMPCQPVDRAQEPDKLDLQSGPVTEETLKCGWHVASAWYVVRRTKGGLRARSSGMSHVQEAAESLVGLHDRRPVRCGSERLDASDTWTLLAPQYDSEDSAD
ncbi:hypothetical protein K438DRAFT_1786673 [Mycena galopus ATCC 62051]|nr:hypothetical protein K438DRAFT_1786673 [Mycena galopus ATCC 62051]